MGKLRFGCTAGALVRGQIKRELEKICFDLNLKLTIKESKGLIESNLSIEIIGDDATITALRPSLDKWLKKIGNRD